MAALPPPYIDLESITIRPSLGLRFRDLVTGQIVGSGLQVIATPVAAPQLATPAQPNRSGVWVFHSLPGLRAHEFGWAPAANEFSPPAPSAFRIEVQDEEERFLPCVFKTDAPRDGLFAMTSGASPPWQWNDVPLFPSPSRPVPAGCAVVRIALAAEEEATPAVWSLVGVSTVIRGRTVQAFGLADENGSATVMFPWPELSALAVASPPGGLRLDAQGWELSLEAWHDFAVSPAPFADLDAVLARLARNPDRLMLGLSPVNPFTHATLSYGRELIIPASPQDPGEAAVLIIIPAV